MYSLHIGFLHGQSGSTSAGARDSLKVSEGRQITAANKDYNKAGGLKLFFFVKHYRTDWATEVEFEIIDLNTEAGGLTPIREGGGHQTKSLRLKGNDGKEWHAEREAIIKQKAKKKV